MPTPPAVIDQLRRYTDEQLLTLLTARPDLASPPPGSIAGLAARLLTKQSIQQALVQLNAFELHVLHIAKALSFPTEKYGKARTFSLNDLASHLTISATTTPEQSTQTLEETVTKLGEQFLLTHAEDDDDAWWALGSVSSTISGEDDEGTQSEYNPGLVSAPEITAAQPIGYRESFGSPQTMVDGVGADRAITLLTLADHALQAWSQGGPVLRTGGVGVRELRSLAQKLSITTMEVGWLLETLASAELIAPIDDRTRWYPSREEIPWHEKPDSERWDALAWAWLTSPRPTWLTGEKVRGTTFTPLQPGVEQPSTAQLRYRVLDALAHTEPGGVLNAEQITQIMQWHTPRMPPEIKTVEAIYSQSQWFGILGAGALTTAGRELATAAAATTAQAEQTHREAAIDALNDALPAEVDTALLQGDYTITIPGRPAPALDWLWDIAAEEQRGVAQVLRISEKTIHAALGTYTGDEILAKLRQITPTGVPQAVEYLIADVERQQLVSPTPPTAPTAPPAPRPSGRGNFTVGQRVEALAPLSATTPQRAVRAIRAGEEEIESGVSDPLVTRQRLSDIHSTGEQRWITLVNSSGQTHRRLIQVANFSGGRVRLLDIENDAELVVRIHRIASVDP